MSRIVIALIVAVAIQSAQAAEKQSSPQPDAPAELSKSATSEATIQFPKIDRQPPLWKRATRTKITSLPKYDPKSDDHFQVDLRGQDLSGFDLKDSLDDLLYASFDVAVHSVKLALRDFGKLIMKEAWTLSNSRTISARGGSRSSGWSNCS